MTNVEIYTKGYCPYCKLAKALLRRHGVDFIEHSLSENTDLFEAMVARADGRRTVPQIFVDGVGLGGADDISLLDEQGLLKPLLEGLPRKAA